MAAMLAGAVVGALVGAAIVAAAAVAAPLTIAIIVGGSVAVGALSMKQLASGLSTIFKLPEPATAAVKAGSRNVFVNGRPAVRAGIDMASPCTGFPMAHGPMITDVIIAQGSSSVYVNGAPFARLKDKLACGAHISGGSENVVIGGETQGTGHFIWDLENWTETFFTVVGGVALIGTAGLAGFAGIGAVAIFGAAVAGTYYAFEGLRALGDRLGPGYADLLQGAAGLGLLFAGPRLARAPKAKAPPVAERPPTQIPATQAAGQSATVPPRYLFRGDTRTPGVIFQDGFQPRGSNTDLYSYAASNTPSVYVGTSKSPNVGRVFAQSRKGGYVYTVRDQPLGRDVNAELGAKSPFPSEQEIAVPGGVKVEDIVGAREVGPDGKFVGPFIKNPRYGKP